MSEEQQNAVVLKRKRPVTSLRMRRAWYAPEGDPPTTPPAPPAPPPPAPATDTTPDKGGQSGQAFTQADIDRIISDRLKRAEDGWQKKLLEGLGVDSMDVLKTTLDTQRQADEAQKTELQKAQDKLMAAEKKAAEAEARAAEVEALRLTERRDSRILAALRDGRAGKPDSILTLLEKDSADLVAAVMKDGEIDEAALKKAVEQARKAYPELFVSGYPGSPSNNNGRVPGERREPIKTNVRF